MADGNILAEKVKLKRAVDGLTERRHHTVCQGHPVSEPSLYAQLRADLAGTQGSDNKTPAKSLPPMWIDACMLLKKIDEETRHWMPEPGDTPHRLQALAFKAWRPQDCEQVREITHTVESWCVSVAKMLNPDRSYGQIKNQNNDDLAACPSCGHTWAYRKDPGGDRVRVQALKWTEKVGFECQACKAHWAPEQTLFFSRLLGFELPEGVLE